MRKVVFFAVALAVPLVLLIPAVRRNAPATEPATEPVTEPSTASPMASPGASAPVAPPADARAGAANADSATRPAVPTTAAPRPTPSAATGAGAPQPAAGSLRSSQSGVYTEAQAQAGAQVYAELCNSCHAPLNNHVGPVFRASWGGATAADMLEYLMTSMPKNDPGSLTSTEYVAVMAYLFKLNGMPAGRAPMAADVTSLKQIRIDTTTAGPPPR